MSDVSGIPNMGFGGGNFFAPQFSYNPQMSAAQASAAYMPAENYAQNVTNNTFASGGGFGRQTAYYAGLGAQYNAAGMSPFGVFSEGGGGGGGGGADTPLSLDNSAWSTSPQGPDWGPGTGFSSGGGGLFSGSLSNSPQQSYSGPSIDWSGVGSAAGNLSGGGYGPGGLSSIGGLGGAPYTPQPSGGFDWSKLWSGGSMREDPAPGMAMPGGLNSPMTFPQQPQQQPQPQQQQQQPQQPQPVTADPYPGMAMPGGLNAPMTASASERPYEQPAFDFNGPNAGWGNAPSTAMPSSQASLGYEPQNIPSKAIDWNLFQSPANDYTTFQGGGTAQSPPADAAAGGALTAGGGLTAADLAEQARGRLAQLMAPETPAEIPAPATPPVVASDEKVPLPVARPAEADVADPYAALPGGIPLPAERPAEAPARPYQDPNAPRPPESVPEFPAARLAPNGQEPELFVVHHTGGRGDPESVVADWRANRPGVGSQYIMDRNGVVHDTLNEYGYGGTGHAIGLEMPGSGVSTRQTGVSNRSIVGMEIVARNEKDVTPAQQAALVQFAQERYPNTPFYGHGEISTNRANDEGIPGAQAVLDARIAAGQGWPSSSFVWPDQASSAPAVSSRAADTAGLSHLNLPPEFPAQTALYPDYANRYGDAAAVSPAAATAAQQAPTWQTNIPSAQRTPEVTAAIQALSDRLGFPAAAVPAVAGVEGSNWNPQYMTGSQAGIFQMAPGDFQTAGGRLGGLTYDQYRNATPAQQIAAYSDFIASSPNAGYLKGVGDPALAAAILQAIQLSPQGNAWAERMLIGDTGSRVTPKPQARELGNTSIDFMRDVMARRIAGER